jgi:hypothetical protein
MEIDDERQPCAVVGPVQARRQRARRAIDSQVLLGGNAVAGRKARHGGDCRTVVGSAQRDEVGARHGGHGVQHGAGLGIERHGVS